MKIYRLVELNESWLPKITPKIFNNLIERNVYLTLNNSLDNRLRLYGYDKNLAGNFSNFNQVFSAIDSMPMRKAEIKESEKPYLEQYLALTDQVMPQYFKDRDTKVKRFHSFRRILMDNLFGDVWYKHLNKPAYKNLTNKQLEILVKLGNRILANPSGLELLNNWSLRWRNKAKSRNKLYPRAEFLVL